MKIITLKPRFTLTYNQSMNGTPFLWKDGKRKYGLSPSIGWGVLWTFIWRTELGWEFWINKILGELKQVKVTWQEYQERWKHDEELIEDFRNWWAKLDEFYKWWNWLINNARWNEEVLSYEERIRIPVRWEDIIYTAYSCSDVTEVRNYDWSFKEYYRTLELIEVLGKWKELLERWSIPEEREKMIEDYEKNQNEKRVKESIRGKIRSFFSKIK
jgi:hypothetical protein